MRGIDHIVSKLAGRAAEIRWAPLKNLLIRLYILAYRINLDDFEHDDIHRYRSFNHFFTRALRPGVRPVQKAPNALLCPADGRLIQLQSMNSDSPMAIKGRHYSLPELLGDDIHGLHGARAPDFIDGSALSVYLSPRDYHRVHMPLAGELRETRYIPGRLFPVNALSELLTPNLFARNERLACFFDGEAGPFAVIFVAALIVGGVRTVWSPDGDVECAPPTGRSFAEGEELGHFRLGSTVVCVFSRQLREMRFDAGAAVQMGQRLASVDQRNSGLSCSSQL